MRFTEEYLFDQGVVPRWYGLSYRVDYMFVSVFYPIPFNLIVRWVRNIWLDVSSINPAYMKEHPWYQAGRRNAADYYHKWYVMTPIQGKPLDPRWPQKMVDRYERMERT